MLFVSFSIGVFALKFCHSCCCSWWLGTAGEDVSKGFHMLQILRYTAVIDPDISCHTLDCEVLARSECFASCGSIPAASTGLYSLPLLQCKATVVSFATREFCFLLKNVSLNTNTTTHTSWHKWVVFLCLVMTDTKVLSSCLCECHMNWVLDVDDPQKDTSDNLVLEEGLQPSALQT